MGQKANPNSIRLIEHACWNSIWFSIKNKSNSLLLDIELKTFLEYYFSKQGIFLNKILIRRRTENLYLDIFSSSRGNVPFKNNSEEKKIYFDLGHLSESIGLLYSFSKHKVFIKIHMESFSCGESFYSKFQEENNCLVLFKKFGQINSNLVANYLVYQIECSRNVRDLLFKRGFSRRNLVFFCTKVLEQSSFLDGIRIEIRGRWTATDRTQKISVCVGAIKSQSVSARVNFCQSFGKTMYGLCGISVWVCHKN